MSRELLIVTGIAGAYLLFVFFRFIAGRSVKSRVRALAKNAVEMTPDEFFSLRSRRGDRRSFLAAKYDYPGVYILYNRTKNMYYVGQAQSVLSRINQHLTGHGNGDVYADFKYGDRFVITSIRLRGSGFGTLNELERHAISVYNAYSRGYNKTRGNQS